MVSTSVGMLVPPWKVVSGQKQEISSWIWASRKESQCSVYTRDPAQITTGTKSISMLLVLTLLPTPRARPPSNAEMHDFSSTAYTIKLQKTGDIYFLADIYRNLNAFPYY